MTVAAILLAGGVGSRMGREMPKQYLLLNSKPIAQYSFDLLTSLIDEVVVVCDPTYQPFFPGCKKFALPGKRRQDSVYNGLQQVEKGDVILIHDSARPLLSPSIVQRVVEAAIEHGAATCGMPLKYTIKECNDSHFVQRTPNREQLFEIQTPQVVRKGLLKRGFEQAMAQKLTVTDDVALVELFGHPVKVVEGCYRNLKITTPTDLAIAEYFLKL